MCTEVKDWIVTIQQSRRHGNKDEEDLDDSTYTELFFIKYNCVCVMSDEPAVLK